MFKLNNWKQKIYWDDLKSVLLNGLLFSIVGGALGGVIDCLLQMIGIPIGVGLIIICYLIGTKLSRAYYNYHILYPVLSIPFMIIGLLSSMFMQIGVITRSIEYVFYLMTMPETYLMYLLSPIYYLISCIKMFDLYALMWCIFNAIVYIYAFVTCYKIIKGRN